VGGKTKAAQGYGWDAWCTWKEEAAVAEAGEQEPEGKESATQWATSRRSSSDSAAARRGGVSIGIVLGRWGYSTWKVEAAILMIEMTAGLTCRRCVDDSDRQFRSFTRG
jgi:hypothetical protein